MRIPPLSAGHVPGRIIPKQLNTRGRSFGNLIYTQNSLVTSKSFSTTISPRSSATAPRGKRAAMDYVKVSNDPSLCQVCVPGSSGSCI